MWTYLLMTLKTPELGTISYADKRMQKSVLFKKCHSQACAVAESIDSKPIMLRFISWKMSFVNTKPNTPFQWYFRNVCYLLLDHHKQGIDNQFDKSLGQFTQCMRLHLLLTPKERYQ